VTPRTPIIAPALALVLGLAAYPAVGAPPADDTPAGPLSFGANLGLATPDLAVPPPWTAPWDGPECLSIGTATNGRLVHGVRLTDDDLIDARERRNYGTPETVEAIRRAARVVAETFPDTDRLQIGDISTRKGGLLRPHRSHQSGRDADIGFYLLGGNRYSTDASSKTLDAPRTWTFIRELLRDDAVEYVFVDYGLQKPLLEYAKSQPDADAEWLERVFQYPRGRRARVGMIRHSRGHRNHMHVRFWSKQSVAAGKAYLERGGARIDKVYVYHRVRRGDSLWKIARRHGIRVRDITRLNRISKRKALQPGQRLIVGQKMRIWTPGDS
jgi:penicillin-insensitive murein endopeptidase